jgi:hypothetical protein
MLSNSEHTEEGKLAGAGQLMPAQATVSRSQAQSEIETLLGESSLRKVIRR